MILRTCLTSYQSSIYLNITRNLNHLSRNNQCKIKLVPNNLSKTAPKSSSYNVNTNVVKDVILFKYDNPRKFKMLNFFAVCQFGFWAYLSQFAFTTLKDAPVEKTKTDLPWWRRINLGENKYRNGVTFITFFVGYSILVAAWMFSLKSVRYLILRKGGQAVTFVTYGPFGQNRMMTVDLKYVCCKETRANAKSYLPIKVQKQYLHYILDQQGEFKNKQLFDATAGLKRIFKDQI